ncbi:MAG: PLP-dependent aminotransferase family protein [Burkholderiales bacterium]
MALVSLDPRNGVPLVEQIVASLRHRIEQRGLRPGTRIPPIRRFADDHNISRFTVVEAYDRLVAQGYLNAKRGSGFYVAARSHEAPSQGTCKLERTIDAVWLVRRMIEDDPAMLKASSAGLPREWLDEAGIRRGLRVLARKNGSHLTEYGSAQGYLPLRNQLQFKLSEIGVFAQASQIVLTTGASHALDLIIRYLLKPGDAVLVDDPGYYVLFGDLKLHGITLAGVPRNEDGPDVAAMEALIEEHKPKAFFTQSVAHNPTGSNLSSPVAFRVLQLAEKHGFTIIEDDAYGDLHAGSIHRLATLDQLQRVIYVGSFSKTLSSSLRVGFLACRENMACDLADIKVLSSITTSEFNERLVYLMLTEGHYHKYLDRVRARLAEIRPTTLRSLERCGVGLFCEPKEGIFLWARVPGHDDSIAIANLAAEAGIVLAPGSVFRPHLEPSPWLRLNVASCNHPKLIQFLKRLRSEG